MVIPKGRDGGVEMVPMAVLGSAVSSEGRTGPGRDDLGVVHGLEVSAGNGEVLLGQR